MILLLEGSLPVGTVPKKDGGTYSFSRYSRKTRWGTYGADREGEPLKVGLVTLRVVTGSRVAAAAFPAFPPLESLGFR